MVKSSPSPRCCHRRRRPGRPCGRHAAGPGGRAVTVFEREPAVGGRTRTIQAPGGYKFDIGPTFFLYPRVLKDIFEACGERLEDHVELKRLDPQYHLVFEGGGEIRATYDLDRLEQEIGRLAPADARNVRRFPRRQPRQARSLPAGAGTGLLEPGRSRLAGHAGGPAEAEAVLQRRQRSQALFRRSARAPRLLVPDEVSRHVAVPVPEPVHDPVVPRIRARRLSSHGRLRRGVGGDGECRAQDGRRHPLEHAGRPHPLRERARPSGSRPAASASQRDRSS